MGGYMQDGIECRCPTCQRERDDREPSTEYCVVHGWQGLPHEMCPGCLAPLREGKMSLDDREPPRLQCAAHGWTGVYNDSLCPACTEDLEKKYWRKKGLQELTRLSEEAGGYGELEDMNGRPAYWEKMFEEKAQSEQHRALEKEFEELMRKEKEADRAAMDRFEESLAQAEGTAGAHQSPSEAPAERGGGKPYQTCKIVAEGLRLPSGIDLGTVVSLRGGGPSMTVVGLPVPKFQTDPQMVECAWEEHGGLLFREFPVKALMFRKE